MPQIVLHLILLSNHKKSKKERRITEIFLQRIPFSLKNHFCLGDVWLSLLETNAQVLLSARSPSLILRCAKQRHRVPASVLALSVIASRCHLSQSERPWQSVKFPVYTLRPAAARGAVRRCAQTFRLCQGLPLWERLPPAGGRCRICDRGRTAGAKRLRGRARQREPCAFV